MTREIYCHNCASYQPLVEETLRQDHLNPFAWGDLVCATCHSIIATVRDVPVVAKVGEETIGGSDC